jgi:lysophospholipase L1-like esterase
MTSWRRIWVVLVMAGCLGWLNGCTSTRPSSVRRQIGESLVFIGEQPAALAYLPAVSQPLRLRSTYLPDATGIEYAEGRDFIVDYAEGTLQRLPGSALPDFRTNMLYGQEEFDHARFPGFGNHGFFAFVDYSFTSAIPWPQQARQTQFLSRTQARLRAGKAVRIVAFGDSITEGGDATKPELIFWQRWADTLQKKYPGAGVTAVNSGTGGDNTTRGLQRLKTKVIEAQPDLVLVGFGMNDHNRRGVPVPRFEENLKEMIARIRSQTPAEIILFSAFPPNPKWKGGSHHMADYAAATARVAGEAACAYANVFDNWEILAARKKPEDLLSNNVNHPDDFGHWIYFRVFDHLGL